MRCLARAWGGTFLVTCSADLSIKIWDSQNEWKNVKTLTGHDHAVSSAWFMPGDESVYRQCKLGSLHQNIRCCLNMRRIHFVALVMYSCPSVAQKDTSCRRYADTLVGCGVLCHLMMADCLRVHPRIRYIGSSASMSLCIDTLCDPDCEVVRSNYGRAEDGIQGACPSGGGGLLRSRISVRCDS